MRKIKELKGAGNIYDARGTGLLPGVKQNGRLIRIRPLFMVEHIPVMPNRKGTADFVALALVLKAQGLHLQSATDEGGSICLYNDLNVLCYQARGANQVSCGVEHMHMSTDEDWTKRQLRASGWLWNYARREYAIPCRVGKIKPRTRGTISVVRKGHVSHARVSQAAGYNDRSDPGPKYDWEYVQHCANFFREHGSFQIRRHGRLIGA